MGPQLALQPSQGQHSFVSQSGGEIVNPHAVARVLETDPGAADSGLGIEKRDRSACFDAAFAMDRLFTAPTARSVLGCGTSALVGAQTVREW